MNNVNWESTNPTLFCQVTGTLFLTSNLNSQNGKLYIDWIAGVTSCSSRLYVVAKYIWTVAFEVTSSLRAWCRTGFNNLRALYTARDAPDTSNYLPTRGEKTLMYHYYFRFVAEDRMAARHWKNLINYDRKASAL